DEEAEVSTGDLTYYLHLAEGAKPELIGPQQGLWLARYDAELENFVSAHAWCAVAPGGAELDLRLVSAIKLYWLNRGLLGLGHQVTLEALLRPNALKPTSSRCLALYDAGQLSFFRGRSEEAIRHLEESLAIARDCGDRRRVATALALLGPVCIGYEDIATARRYSEEALSVARELGDTA